MIFIADPLCIFGAFLREDKVVTQVILFNILAKLRVFKLYFMLFIFIHTYVRVCIYMHTHTFQPIILHLWSHCRNSIGPNVCLSYSLNPKFPFSYRLTPTQEIFLQYECIHLKTIGFFLPYGLSHSRLSAFENSKNPQIWISPGS